MIQLASLCKQKVLYTRSLVEVKMLQGRGCWGILVLGQRIQSKKALESHCHYCKHLLESVGIFFSLEYYKIHSFIKCCALVKTLVEAMLSPFHFKTQKVSASLKPLIEVWLKSCLSYNLHVYEIIITCIMCTDRGLSGTKHDKQSSLFMQNFFKPSS